MSDVKIADFVLMPVQPSPYDIWASFVISRIIKNSKLGVIEALKPLEGERKCHRLINGVLIERTVSQVLPALTLNFDNVNII